MKQAYRIDGRLVVAGDRGFEDALRGAYARKTKVYCGCRNGAQLPLYISNRFGKLVLARWPGSGASHSTACDHFEAPDFLSGMGQVRGAAVMEDEATGETSLKVAFPLSRGPARASPASLGNDKPGIRSTGYKLSMRGLLHVLWDRAELTHWHPKMGGKRNWYIVRRALLEAAHSCRLKTLPLGDLLFVPETFRLEEKDELARRRSSALERVRRSRDEMMVMIAEIKERKPFEDRLQLVVKHAPDMRFVLDPDMARRFNKRFEGELNLWASDAEREGHLIVAGSFCRRPEGTFDLIEVALMPVTREWLPYECTEELALIAKAVAGRRRFVKGMRVNLERAVPIASIVLKDMGARPTAVHLHDEQIEPGAALEALLGDASVDHFLWWEGEALPKAGAVRPDRGRSSGIAAVAGPGSPAAALPAIAGQSSAKAGFAACGNG